MGIELCRLAVSPTISPDFQYIEDALLTVVVQHLEATGFVGELPPVPEDVSYFVGTVEEYEYSV